MFVVSGLGVALESLRFFGHRVPGLPPRDDGTGNASTRHSMDQSSLESLGRLPHQHSTAGPRVCFHAAPNVAYVRRDRAGSLPAANLAKEFAGMGFSSRGRNISTKRREVVCPFHVAGVDTDADRAWSNVQLEARRTPGDGYTLRHLDVFAFDRLLGQQAATSRIKTVDRRRQSVCAIDRAPHVALL